MGKRTVRKYTPGFKQEAAKLAIRIGATRAAGQLGVIVGNVQRWKQKVEDAEPQTKNEIFGMIKKQSVVRRPSTESKLRDSRIAGLGLAKKFMLCDQNNYYASTIRLTRALLR